MERSRKIKEKKNRCKILKLGYQIATAGFFYFIQFFLKAQTRKAHK